MRDLRCLLCSRVSLPGLAVLNLGKILFGVATNRAIAQWIADTQERVALVDLVIIQKGLVVLVYRPADQLSCARAAGPSFAGIRQINALLFGSVKDGGVF